MVSPPGVVHERVPASFLDRDLGPLFSVPRIFFSLGNRFRPP